MNQNLANDDSLNSVSFGVKRWKKKTAPLKVEYNRGMFEF